MADEIDAGQERGDMVGNGRPDKALQQVTVSDLGLTRKNVHDFRKVRDAVSKGLPM